MSSGATHPPRRERCAGFPLAQERGAPDFDRALAEFDRLVALLEQFGMEINLAPADRTTGLDSIYMHDPLVISDRGAILGRSGKEARIAEAEMAQPDKSCRGDRQVARRGRNH